MWFFVCFFGGFFVACWSVFFVGRIEVTSVTEAQIIINPWVWYSHITTHKKCLIQIQINVRLRLKIWVSWSTSDPLIANMWDLVSIQWMLVVLISFKQTTTKTTIQLIVGITQSNTQASTILENTRSWCYTWILVLKIHPWQPGSTTENLGILA